MGFAMLAVCSDLSDADAALGELMGVIGSDSYPSTFRGARTARWSVSPAWHTNTPVVVNVDAEGRFEVEASTGSPDGAGSLNDSSWGWEPSVSSSQMNELVRRVRSDAMLARRASAGGVEAALGVRRSRTPGFATVWLVRADGVGMVCSEQATVARNMAEVVLDGFTSAAGPSSFTEAISHLGSFTVPDGSVRLVWCGNRVCEPSALGTDEAAALSRRF